MNTDFAAGNEQKDFMTSSMRMTVTNKEVIVPTICSAIVAGVSLVFYSALVQTVNVELSAAFIAATSLAAIIQISFVPQSWIYVFGAHEPKDRATRASTSAIIEVCGAACGLLVAIPVALVSRHGMAVLLAYIALSMAGSTGAQGKVRGEGRWVLYAVFVTLPTILRLAIVTIAMLSRISIDDSLSQLIVIYLLIPEGVRYLLLNVPLTGGSWQPVTRHQLKDTANHVFRNMIYDIGSAVTEVADKYILYLIISPSLFIVYFFVRKISSAVTIILEPFYSSRYRALVEIRNLHGRMHNLTKVLRDGYLIAAIMCVLILAAIKVLSLASLGRLEIIPGVIQANVVLFAACLFVDGSIAANRWGRYISIMNNSAVPLLIARWICFVVFILTVMGLSAVPESIALAIGFLCYALLELTYVARSTRLRTCQEL